MASESQSPTPKKTRVKALRWRPAFLATLRNTANVRESCLVAGINRDTAYHARKQSAEFRQQWDVALQDACDILETEARRRALEISDTLLIFLLKSHRPEVYRERVQIDFGSYVDQYGLDEETKAGVVAQAEAIVRGR
jgi:hypothetical protein